jgi:Uma2 family endonuclease
MTFTTPEAVSEYEQERGKPMPSKNHAVVQANLIYQLKRLYGEKCTVLSELTLDTDPPATPDVSIYAQLSANWLHDEVRVAEPPLMVVEILSPSQSVDILIPKIERYFAFGVKSVWLVQPPLQQVAVFTPEMEPQVYSSGEVVDSVLDVRIALTEIFA